MAAYTRGKDGSKKCEDRMKLGLAIVYGSSRHHDVDKNVIISLLTFEAGKLNLIWSRRMTSSSGKAGVLNLTVDSWM